MISSNNRYPAAHINIHPAAAAAAAAGHHLSTLTRPSHVNCSCSSALKMQGGRAYTKSNSNVPDARRNQGRTAHSRRCSTHRSSAIARSP
jgi:hypothetical protein